LFPRAAAKHDLFVSAPVEVSTPTRMLTAHALQGQREGGLPMLARELRRIHSAAAVAAIGIVAAAFTLTPGTASAQQPPPPPQAPAPYPPQAAPPQAPAPYPPQAYPPQAYPPQAYPPAPYPYPQQAGPAPIYIMTQPQQQAPLGPRRITDWEEGQPIPAGYHVSTHVRVGMIVGGAVTFGVVYLITALTGALVTDVGSATGCGTTCSSAKPLLIPIAGPFIVLPHTGSATGDFGLVLDGLAQMAGVGLIIGGIAAPKVELVRDEVGTFKVAPTPLVFDNKGAGFGFKGTF
jgi:hypothetical protein